MHLLRTKKTNSHFHTPNSVNPILTPGTINSFYCFRVPGLSVRHHWYHFGRVVDNAMTCIDLSKIPAISEIDCKQRFRLRSLRRFSLLLSIELSYNSPPMPKYYVKNILLPKYLQTVLCSNG